MVIPVVENAVAGSAFRPGDIIRARNGLTVEIGFTAALFLKKFVARNGIWAHLDNPMDGQTNEFPPIGGTDHAIRANCMTLKAGPSYRNIP